MTKHTRAPSLVNPTATAWFPLAPAAESAVIDMADARTVALRERLRNHYWLTDCRPLTTADIDLQRRKMRMIRDADGMEQSEVDALLTPTFGFECCPTGWTIPALDIHRDEVLDAKQQAALRAAAAGRASAAARASRTGPSTPPTAPASDDPQDF